VARCLVSAAAKTRGKSFPSVSSTWAKPTVGELASGEFHGEFDEEFDEELKGNLTENFTKN
jgi:hypothetical protein